MNRDEPRSTARSELRSIGRSLDDLQNHEEANAQALQTVMPWLWLQIGVVIAMVFACLVTLGPLPASRALPAQSPVFSAPVPHR